MGQHLAVSPATAPASSHRLTCFRSLAARQVRRLGRKRGCLTGLSPRSVLPTAARVADPGKRSGSDVSLLQDGLTSEHTQLFCPCWSRQAYVRIWWNHNLLPKYIVSSGRQSWPEELPKALSVANCESAAVRSRPPFALIGQRPSQEARLVPGTSYRILQRTRTRHVEILTHGSKIHAWQGQP